MSGEKLGILFNKQLDSRTYKTETSSWTLPNQNIGIEVEIENMRSDLGRAEFAPLMALWQIQEDHSLRDNGWEFTTRGPLFGDDLNNAVDLLMAKATEHGWKPSIRTGIHIHMDMRDADASELMYLCSLYSIFEKSLFRWVGEQREDNIYCVPWYKAQENLKHVAAFGNENMNFDLASEVMGKIQRYSALNLQSLAKFSTLEFRHMDTQVNGPRIKTWINLLMCLKKYARTFSESHDKQNQLLATFSQMGPRAFAEDVFGPMFETLNSPGLENEMWDGLLIAQDVVVLYNKRFNSMFPDAELWNGEKNPAYKKFFETHKKEEKIVSPHPDFTGWRITTHRNTPPGYTWIRNDDVMEGELVISHLNSAEIVYRSGRA